MVNIPLTELRPLTMTSRTSITGAPVTSIIPDELEPISDENESFKDTTVNTFKRAFSDVGTVAGNTTLGFFDVVIPAAVNFSSDFEQVFNKIAPIFPAAEVLLTEEGTFDAIVENPVQGFGEFLNKTKAKIFDQSSENIIKENQANINFLRGLLPEEFEVESPNVVREFGLNTLPNALGQTAGFILATIGSRGRNVAAARAAVVGSEVSRAEFERSALEGEATPEQLEISSLLGRIVGTSEALGLNRLLRVSNDTRLLKELEQVGTPALKKLLESTTRVGKNAVVSAVEEGFQEAFQTGALNLTARDIAGFDPDRPLSENLAVATSSGAGAGFFLSLIGSAIGIKPRNLAQAEFEARLEELANDPQNLENVGGIFSIVTPEQLDILASVRETREELQAAANQINEGTSANDILAEDSRIAQHIGFLGKDNVTDPILEARDISREDINKLKINFATELTSTISEEFDSGGNLLQKPVTLFRDLNDVEKGVFLSGAFDQIENLRQFKKIAPEDIQEVYDKGLEQRLSVIQDSLRLVEAAQKTYLPDSKVILDFGNLGNKTLNTGLESAFGATFSLNDNIVINVNLDNLITRATDPADLEALVFSNVSHELGHQILANNFHKAPESVQNALFEEYNRALRAGLLNNEEGTLIQQGLEISRNISNNTSKVLNTQDPDVLNGFLSFTEFLAQRTADAFASPAFSGNAVTQEFFTEGRKVLERLFNTIPGINPNTPGVFNKIFNTPADLKQRNSFKDQLFSTIKTQAKKRGVTVKLDNKLFGLGNVNSTVSVGNNKVASSITIDPIDKATLEFTIFPFLEGTFSTNERFTFRNPNTLRDALEFLESNQLFDPDGNIISSALDKLIEFQARDLSNKAGRVVVPKKLRNIAELIQSPRVPTTFGAYLKHLTAKGYAESLKRDVLSKQDNVFDKSTSIRTLVSKGFKSKLFNQKHLVELDKFNRVMKWGFDIIQLAEVNPHVQGLQRFKTLADNWTALRTGLADIATGRLNNWRKLGKEQSNKLANALYDEQTQKVTLSRADLEQRGLSQEAITLKQNISRDMSDILNQLERMSTEQAQRRLQRDPLALQARLEKIQEEFTQLRKRPFFPLYRFGNHAVLVREKVKLDNGETTTGKVVYFESWDSQKKQQRSLSEVEKQFPSDKFVVSSTFLEDNTLSLQGLPASVIDQLIREVSLTPEQITQINEFIINKSPNESFAKHQTRRKTIAGFSLDAQRTYASYMQLAGSHISRLTVGLDMQEAVADVRRTAKEISTIPGTDNRKRVQMANFMQANLDYMMNPGNELASLRSMGFFLMLGYNVSSAFVNTTQLPLVTLPFLSSKHGDVRAAAALTTATKDAVKYLTKPSSFDKDPELQRTIAKAIRDNKVNQSLATNLAVATEMDNLDRLMNNPTVGLGISGEVSTFVKKSAHNIQKWGAMPFHVVEEFNRLTTLIAAYRLNRTDGLTEGQAYVKAINAIDATQFEYSKHARPQFLRGKQSALLLFTNFIRNGLFNILGGRSGAFRMNMMLLLLAGPLGLPFAEDILDVLDLVVTKSKDLLGMKDPKTQLRVDAREWLNQNFENPDIILHGLSRESFGMSKLAQAVGIPLPEIDISRRIGFGDILPGTEVLNTTGDFNDRFTALAEDSGALQSFTMQMLRAYFDKNPDNFKRLENSMPLAGNNLVKSVRYLTEGTEETLRGDIIAEFDVNDPVQMMEVAAQSLGFTPTKTAEGWEEYIAKKQVSNYYITRRQVVMAQYVAARRANDREALADVNKRIAKFNSQVPFAELKISSKDKSDSFTRDVKDRIRAERGIPANRRVLRLEASIEDIFNPDEGITEVIE